MRYVKKYELKMVKESSFPYEDIQIGGSDDTITFFRDTLKMHEFAMEQVWTLFLDAKHKIIGCEQTSKGGLSGATLSSRDLIKSAILMNASAIIIAHNHPSGDPKPSPEDISTTKKIIAACDLMDIPLLDHIIVGDNQYISMKRQGII